MTALALAAAVVLAGRCAAQIAPETLLSVARAESGLNPLAIHDNATSESLHAADVPSAATLAAARIRAGHSVDLGIMQINSANLGAVHLTVLGAFDACASLRAGAAILQHAYSGGSTPDAQQRALRVALSRYNTGDPDTGFTNGYVGRVERVAEQIVPAIQIDHRPDQSVSTQQNPAAANWDVWGEETAPPVSPVPMPIPAQTEPTGDQKAAPVLLHPGLIKRAS